MRVLVSISILAFLALLWASIGIARHVRRVRHARIRSLKLAALAQHDDLPGA